MSIDLDHFFIWTDVGAPAAAALTALGFVEGAPNIHPGQGTANRRFFFDNAMLELLWVQDEAEAGSAPVRRLHLLERWQGREAGASPFGLCFRPVGAAAQALPFPGWTYQPSYLPEGVSMHIGFRRRRRTCLYLLELCEKARDQPTARGVSPGLCAADY